MYTHVDKARENKRPSVTNAVSDRKNGESGFQFVDNRAEAAVQRKRQEMANNSPGVRQLRALQEMADNSPQAQQAAQLQAAAGNYANPTGMPDKLKAGVENLSGYSMDDVKVHYNSSKPAQFSAHAYAQGNNIHLGTGQEKHLPHEAWHVVQQKQGRVAPTLQMGSLPINDDRSLEQEADEMGSKANTGVVQKKNQTLLSGQESDSAQMQFAMLEPLAAYFGVEASIASVALALGIAPATLTLGLQALGALAVVWGVRQVVKYFAGPAVADAAPAVAGTAPVVAAPAVAGPAVAGPVVAAPAVAGPAVAGPVVAGPAVAGPVVAGPAVAGPVVAGPVVAGPAVAGPVVAGPVVAGPVAAGPAVAGPAVAGPVVAGPVVAGPAPVVAPAPPAARRVMAQLPGHTTRDDLFARSTEIGNEIDTYDHRNEDNQTHLLLQLRGWEAPIAGWFAALDAFNYPSTMTFNVDYSARGHGGFLHDIDENLRECVQLLNNSYARVYPPAPVPGAAGTPLTNTVSYYGTHYTTREALHAAIAVHTGDAIPINQAIGRMDTNTDVTNNNLLSRPVGAADAPVLLLRAARHCSFGMGPNGCALFFLQAGAGAITLVGIGHHYQNNSRRYNIVSAAPGYPIGKFQFPGA